LLLTDRQSFMSSEQNVTAHCIPPTLYTHSYINCLKIFGRKYELQTFPLRSDYLRGLETSSLLGPIERADINYWDHQTHRYNSLESDGQCSYKFVGFEVFTAATANNAVFWDMAPCGSCKNRRFGRTCYLHLQGRRNNASEERC
jgi:hypothetical protein